MLNSKRRPINKHRGAKAFKHQAHKTDRRNIAQHPMRGGFRL